MTSASSPAPAAQGNGPADDPRQVAARAKINRPAVGVIFGLTKRGKTTDTLYSFPGGHFIAAPGALKPSIKTVGWVPESTDEILDLDGIRAKLHEIEKRPAPQRPSALIIDDTSLAADTSFQLLSKKYQGWDLQKAVRERTIDIIHTARRLGMHVIYSCHEVEADVKYGREVGGPQMPTAKLTSALVGSSDFSLRVTARLGGLGWRFGYAAGANYVQAWAVGDRLGVVTDLAPMNLREILLAAGFEVPRARGMEWLDAEVEQYANAVLSGQANEMQVVQHIKSRTAPTGPLPDYVARWLMRDALDRAALRQMMINSRFSLFGA